MVAQVRQPWIEGLGLQGFRADRERAPAGPILLVEHYPLLAKPLVRGLEEEGIVAHLARDDGEAEVRVRAMPYAAVVLDWNIPRRGGAALVRGWRRAGLVVPVLAFLPAPDEANLRQALAAGADTVFGLPFSFADLLTRLRAWVTPADAWPIGATRTSRG
jgi:DNA-binding response OmpR family regulator